MLTKVTPPDIVLKNVTLFRLVPWSFLIRQACGSLLLGSLTLFSVNVGLRHQCTLWFVVLPSPARPIQICLTGDLVLNSLADCLDGARRRSCEGDRLVPKGSCLEREDIVVHVQEICCCAPLAWSGDRYCTRLDSQPSILTNGQPLISAIYDHNLHSSSSIHAGPGAPTTFNCVRPSCHVWTDWLVFFLLKIVV